MRERERRVTRNSLVDRQVRGNTKAEINLFPKVFVSGLMSLSGPEMTKQEKNSSTAVRSSKRKHLSSLLFFFISVYSNFTIQYNVFQFNKLQWVVLLVGGVILWLIPFLIEKTANKMILTLVSRKTYSLTLL